MCSFQCAYVYPPFVIVYIRCLVLSIIIVRSVLTEVIELHILLTMSEPDFTMQCLHILSILSLYCTSWVSIQIFSIQYR